MLPLVFNKTYSLKRPILTELLEHLGHGVRATARIITRHHFVKEYIYKERERRIE
jgi:hypothetical protein